MLSVFSNRVMTQMRDLGVVAFFGPDGTCHTEATLASAWNLPLISHVSSFITASWKFRIYLSVRSGTI